MKIAIDGPAGSGKSTVARALAGRCGLVLLDTGAMYRSVTLLCLEQNVDVTDADAVAAVAKDAVVEFGTAEDGTQTVAVNGRDVTSEIRTPEVDANVSAVSAIPAVRESMVAQQRAMGARTDVVAEGRDIGTVVFPDAEVKVFLTADPEARAHRRAVQRAGGDAATDPNATTDAATEQEVLADLVRRDEADSSREASPLRPADDATHIDSSSMGVDEVVDRIVALMQDATKAEVQATEVNAHAAKSEPTREEKPKSSDDSEKSTTEAGEYDSYYDGAVREFPLSARLLLAATVGVCGALSKIFWHWKLEGGEKIWNADGGRVVVMNHVSMLDPVVLVVSDWAHGRRMRPIYKSEFDKHKLVTWFFAKVGAIPVKRGTADIKAVRRAQRALQRGEDVLVFPEGTRIYSDDQKVTIHGGFALMAQLAKVPVVPVAIVGARDGAPGGNKPLRPGRVWMRVGDEVTFDELNVKGRKKQAKEMERVAMERVYALRDALRGEHPGKM